MRTLTILIGFLGGVILTACGGDSSTGEGSGGKGGGAGGAGGSTTGGAGGVAAGGTGGAATGGAGGVAAGGSGGSGGTATGGAGGAGGGGPTPEQVQACTSIRQVVCEGLQQCLSFSFDLFYTSVADCVKQSAANCAEVSYAEGSNLTPAAQAECQAALAALDCDALRQRFTEPNPPPLPGCEPIPGNLADGTACVSGAQCQSSFCDIPESSLCGTCAQRHAAGDQCFDDFQCVADHTCISSRCTPVARQGDACGPMIATCGDDLACTGTCGPPIASGATCDAQNYPFSCETGQVCNFMNNVCEPFVNNGYGDPCGIDQTTGSFAICGPEAKCDIDLQTGTGTCQSTAGVNEACFPGPALEGSQCEPGLRCINGTCLAASRNACP